MACMLATMVALSSAGPLYAFGRGQHWILLDPQSGTSTKLELPSGVFTNSLAVSGNAQEIAFTAVDPKFHNTTLYSWDRDVSEKPIRVGETTGYHADPVFSANGKWIYFAHNAHGSGSPTAHSMRAYAEIYRVHPDGTGLQRLSKSKGCHYSPRPSSTDALFLIHSSCAGEAWIEKLLIPGSFKSLAHINGTPHEILVDSKSRTALVASRDVDFVEVDRITLDGTAKSRRVLRFRASGPDPRIRWGRTHHEFLYQSAGAVWRFDGRTSRKIAQLGGHP